MIVSVAVFVAVSMLFLHLWGNHGLWAAFMLLMLMRGFTLTSRWKKFVAETEFDD
jgi:MATE family multidrug resistance protein